VRLWDAATGAALQTLEGAHRLGQRSDVLAGRQAGGVGLGRWDGSALGRGDGRRASDARGAHLLGPRSNVLARRQAGSVGLGRCDGAALGRGDGRRASDARGAHRLSPRSDVLVSDGDDAELLGPSI
jgi:hypothetical protein